MSMPVRAARFSRGTEADTMVKAPLIRADAPIPETARPTISMADDCAAPQMTDPNSKKAKNAMNDHCVAQLRTI